jgi:hypothetical protein
MRQMVCQWSDGLDGDDAYRVTSRILHKSTLARSADTFIRAFKPRFVTGNPENSWKLARAIEEMNPPIEIVRPFYYWLTARAEPLMREFVSTELIERAKSHDPEIRIKETACWISNKVGEDGRLWTTTVRLKVARGMLAALRDFGILEGATRKRIASQNLPVEAFCLIAYCLHAMGYEQKSLVRHSDWRLFLLSNTAVERLFLESHQNGWLDYQCVGEIYRIEFKSQTFEEFVHVLFRR